MQRRGNDRRSGFLNSVAISMAYQNAKLSNNGALIQQWDEIPRKGDIPSAVEMIDYLSMRVLETKTCFELNNDQVKDDRKGRPYTDPSN